MKRQIRRSVFETNSSSSHSVTVVKRDEYYTTEEIMEDIYLRQDGTWNIYDYDFYYGRSPFRVLCTFKDKWKYACASMCMEYKDDVWNELEAIAMKYIPGLVYIKLPMHTGTRPSDECDCYDKSRAMNEEQFTAWLAEKEEKWEMSLEYWQDTVKYWCYDCPDTGGVDEDILTGFLKKEGITLEEYITNKKYVVICDGDEYNYWDDMKKSGLVNMDMIEKEY